MGKVLLIGGSPMIGKSTVAKRIAIEYSLNCISTDDIGEILQTALNIDPMMGRNYLEYYENTDVNSLIEDLKKYHSAMKRAIIRMIDKHSALGESMIIEGYAVYPDIVLNENTDAIWLIASENLLRKRLEQSKVFQNASNKAKENYLCRSLWHNCFIYDKCVEYGCKYINISVNETIYDLSSKIIKETNLNLQG